MNRDGSAVGRPEAGPGGGAGGRRGHRSLFWTFAGAFFLVLLVAGGLQVVLLSLFFEPLIERWNAERARSTAASLAMEIGALPDSAATGAVARALQRAGDERVGVRYVFLGDRGDAIMDGPLPPGHRRELERMVRQESNAPPGRAGGPLRPRRMSRGPIVIATAPVAGPARSGQVVAIGPPARLPFLPGAASRRAVAFLPVALLVALAGGLVIFRMIVRRLEALEHLAGQVAEGRLDVRVSDTGQDEIGRLGARLNDMTARLAALRTREAEDERTRRQLLADITHELATPLTSIRGNAETMLDRAVPMNDGERTTYLRGIVDEADRMNRLIQDLLDLTRLEAGGVPLELEPLDLAALARNTIDRFQARFREAGLSLQWPGSTDPVRVHGDGRRLEQVLDNLLVNALRYVPAGGSVTVAVSRFATASVGAARARLTVTDDGPGIPEADRGRVFDRFYRGDATRGASEGSGLGLAIVREIVTRHGGRVSVETAPPRGSVFTVDLPTID